VKLRALGLRLRVGGSTEGSQVFAALAENLTEERKTKQEGHSTEIGNDHGRLITTEGWPGLVSRRSAVGDLGV
jgi:hypothetical protein